MTEREFLLADIATLRRMIDESPPDAVLDIASLRARLARQEADLADCDDVMPTVALATPAPAVEWRDYQSDSVATVGPIELTVWAHGTEWRWCVDVGMHTVRAGDPCAPESSRDAAKAAAIAAARAWRDSIRL